MSFKSTGGLKLGMIWAQSSSGVIGKKGDMPWHLPEDLAHFKAVTLGMPVIMGRRTWESLPERFRPLPGRLNIVVTRNRDFVANGAQTVANLDDAFELINSQYGQGSDEAEVDAWIMGGGELYRHGMPHADTLMVTQIFIDVQGADTFAPEIDESWQLVSPGEVLQSSTGLKFKFERYGRN